MSSLVIGIDGGGTKTRVVAAPADVLSPPEAISSADSGPCNIAAVSVAVALGNVTAAVVQLSVDPRSVTAVCAGIAGFSYAERRRDFLAGLSALWPGAVVTVVPDFVAAHVGAHAGGHGITAIAGTGAVAYGRSKQGREHRAGGYGHLIDDGGSGYGVGRRAIAAVLTAADGSGEGTSLCSLLAAELGSIDRAFLIEGVYGGKLDRVRIAGLARQVADAARRGDSVARAILVDAANSQARSVAAVANVLFAGAEPVPVTMYGSLWKAGASLVDPFVADVKSRIDRAVVTEARYEAAIGAAIHARIQTLPEVGRYSAA